MRVHGEIRLPLLDHTRSTIRIPSRVAFALLCSALALGAGRALEPLVIRPYFVPAAIAYILAALAAGTWYGVLTSAVFAAGHAVIHLPPRGSFSVIDPRELLAVVGFFVAGSVVSVLAGALRKSYDRLREQHRLLSVAQAQREDLLSALAHDIRSPLGVVTLNAAAIARSAGKEDADSIRRRALLIEGSAAAITSMLGDLVEAATVESGHVRLERTRVDVAAFAEELKARFAGTLALDRLRLCIPPDLPRVHVDPHRFERIVMNLLTNALKYTPVGGSVTLGAALHGSMVVVSVTDEGAGIAAEDLPHIFDKYFRARDARSEPGLGLGLFIVRLLVEAHGGKIWAESKAGAGTTFKIALPTAPPAVDGHPLQESAEAAPEQ